MIERYVGGANGSPTHRVPSDCDGIVCRNALGSCSAEAYSGVAGQPRDARVEKLCRGLRHLEIKVAVVDYAWAREREFGHSRVGVLSFNMPEGVASM